MKWAFDLTEKGLVPDAVIRGGIRHLVKQRLKEIHADDIESMADEQNAFIAAMKQAVVAPLPEKANEQHYEVPAAFYLKSLGENLKYSSAVWGEGVTSLNQAEADALQATCEHAKLEDGQRVLELGCGWGSLTLWMAKHYPNSQITGVSNSNSQRYHIMAEAAKRGLGNIEIITCDMNDFKTQEAQFDRIVSVEMFEHMRNWPALYALVASWLKADGMFFKHIFVHRTAAYAFEDNGPDDWMSRYFFSGGIMPSDDLPLHFQDQLRLKQRWRWDGTHYEKTANAWLENMDNHRTELFGLFEETYGKDDALMWWNRWRLFFMACAELFGYDNGQEWFVSHYLFSKADV